MLKIHCQEDEFVCLQNSTKFKQDRTHRDEHVPRQQSSDSEPVEDDVDHLEFVFRTPRAGLHLFHHADLWLELLCEDKMCRNYKIICIKSARKSKKYVKLLSELQ